MTAIIRPTIGRTYWAAMAEPGEEWTTVYSSHYGALVNPDGLVDYGAALFTTRELAEAHRTLRSNLPGVVAVRDSKDREGPKLVVSGLAWSEFVQRIKHGEFDL